MDVKSEHINRSILLNNVMTRTAFFKDAWNNIYEFPTKEVFTIGRNQACDITVPPGKNRINPPEENSEQYTQFAMTISRTHATILRKENKHYIIDNGSTRGTFILLPESTQWRKVETNEEAILLPRTKIRLGMWELEFFAEQ